MFHVLCGCWLGLTMNLVVIPGLLDPDSGTPYEIATALSELRHVNQWFGGIVATQSLITRVLRGTGAKSLSMLEVAAGSGFVPHAVAARMRKLGLLLQVTL